MIVIALEGEKMVKTTTTTKSTYLNQNKLYIRLFFKKIKRFFKCLLTHVKLIL